MTIVPSVSYVKVLHALERLGFVVVRQNGNLIHLKKRSTNGIVLRITVPADKPVFRHTLAKILKQAQVPIEVFLEAL